MILQNKLFYCSRGGTVGGTVGHSLQPKQRAYITRLHHGPLEQFCSIVRFRRYDS